MAWTDAMVEQLKKLWSEGVTTGEIGRRLNISKNSIVGKVHRLGLSGRPSPIKKKDDSAPAKKTVTKEKNVSKKKESQQVIKKEPKQTVEKKPLQKKQEKPAPQKAQQKQIAPQIKAEAPLAADDEADIKLAQSLNESQNKTKNKENIKLTDLDNHTCRWPLGDPKDDHFHFCGKKVRLGQTYCEEHAAVAYVKPGKK